VKPLFPTNPRWRARAEPRGDPQVHNARTREHVESFELTGGGAMCVSVWTSGDGMPFLLVRMRSWSLIFNRALTPHPMRERGKESGDVALGLPIHPVPSRALIGAAAGCD
jgi:hypothetical protein